MIDFTRLLVRNKTDAGANGSKISVIYNGEQYMLKFPAVPSKNREMSYTNGCVSEYIGCHIFESAGILVQETLLGTYERNGKKKVVVACKDFTAGGLALQDFASLKNTMIDSVQNGYGTEREDILLTLEGQSSMKPEALKAWFWILFILDALTGNGDRHNGNWGFLYSNATDEITLAPVYDCGSCLFPQADEEIMKKVLEDSAERDLRVCEIPFSGRKRNGQKIRYFDFLSSLQNRDCNKAIKRILPKIDMEKIDCGRPPFLPELQISFYKAMRKERKERILDFSYQKFLKRERAKSQER